jgi:hypothetical protein
MPLTDPAARAPIHKRAIEINGYRRDDGLFDIEATLADTKSYVFTTVERGGIPVGDRLHGMAMRLTVDETLTIVACEAAMDDTPYRLCPEVAPNFSRLAGLRIGRGFTKAAAERVGGPEGCTHLRELLAQMATVAFQTVAPLRRASGSADVTKSRDVTSLLIDSCYAYSAKGDLVRRRWPEFYQGEGPVADQQAS